MSNEDSWPDGEYDKWRQQKEALQDDLSQYLKPNPDLQILRARPQLTHVLVDRIIAKVSLDWVTADPDTEVLEAIWRKELTTYLGHYTYEALYALCYNPPGTPAALSFIQSIVKTNVVRGMNALLKLRDDIGKQFHAEASKIPPRQGRRIRFEEGE